jgi:transposase
MENQEILVKQETMLANLIRGCLGEFGIVAPLGIRRVPELIAVIKDEADSRILPEARIAMRAVADQLCDLQKRTRRSNRRSEPGPAAIWPRSNEASRRLATIPGIGSITASAIVATVASATEFKSPRHFAAFLGLTSKQCSTGGRQRLGRISKQGDVYIRRLLVLGGTSLVRHARGAGGSVWAKQLLARRPTRIVTVALANKAARVIWALLTRGDVYRAPQPQAA